MALVSEEMPPGLLLGEESAADAADERAALGTGNKLAETPRDAPGSSAMTKTSPQLWRWRQAMLPNSLVRGARVCVPTV